MISDNELLMTSGVARTMKANVSNTCIRRSLRPWVLCILSLLVLPANTGAFSTVGLVSCCGLENIYEYPPNVYRDLNLFNTSSHAISHICCIVYHILSIVDLAFVIAKRRLLLTQDVAKQLGHLQHPRRIRRFDQ